MQAPPSPSRQQITELLERSDILPTRQRVDIASLLLVRNQHLTADQLLSQINANSAQHSISKATVYNTLGLLVRKGLIRELVIDPDRVVYDSNLKPHYHLFNVDSGELQDVSTDTIHINIQPKLPTGTTAIGIDVVIRIRNNDSKGPAQPA